MINGNKTAHISWIRNNRWKENYNVRDRYVSRSYLVYILIMITFDECKPNYIIEEKQCKMIIDTLAVIAFC